MTLLSDRSAHFQWNLQAWRLRQLEPFAAPIRDLALTRIAEIDRVDYVQANQECLRLCRTLKQAHVGKAFDEEELRACAENYARTCSQLRPADPTDVLDRLSGGARRESSCDGPVTWLPIREPSYSAQLRTFAAQCAFAVSVGLESVPANRCNRFFGLSARLQDPLWWRRQLRKLWSRQSEQALRELGTVRKGADLYASESAVRLRADQQRRMRRFLEQCVAVNQDGEALSLESLVEHSLSNPSLRRGELMARIRGFETIADELRYDAIFATVTAPSAFHPRLFQGGSNPRYQGATVREAQQWLCLTWSRVRAQLDRDGIKYFGVRVAEPHHDGTPHWHLLLFVPRSQRKQLSSSIVHGWLKEYGSEPGAYRKRVTIERIDRRKGSATGYIAKYIAKNLDAAGAIHAQMGRETGVGLGESVDHGLGVEAGITRVLAWASVHGVRQFQQLGGPPVGLYREARRIREVVGDGDVERARAHADRGNWRGFCLATGYRFNTDHSDRQLSELWRREQRERRKRGIPTRRRFKTHLRLVVSETGLRNRYGELKPCQVIGLRWSATELFTRLHHWRIERKGINDNPIGSVALSAHTPPAAAAGTVQKNSDHARLEMDAPPCRVPVPLGPVALTVRPELDDVDLADKWYHRTDALIRQLACRYRMSERPKTQRTWRWEGTSSRLVPVYVHGEATGPPH